MEERLKSKRLYKIELYLLKIMPMVIALAYLINTVFSYYDIDIPIISYIAGISFIPLLFMYVSSYVFRFCEYHRMFLHYIVINILLDTYDYYVGIPVSNRSILCIHLIIACITLFIILYLYVKSHKRITS